MNMGNLPEIGLSSDKDRIKKGGSAVLTWKVKGAETATLGFR